MAFHASGSIDWINISIFFAKKKNVLPQTNEENLKMHTFWKWFVLRPSLEKKTVIFSNLQDVALMPIEKDDETHKPRVRGELVFKTKQSFKTRVTKTSFAWIVPQNFDIPNLMNTESIHHLHKIFC